MSLTSALSTAKSSLSASQSQMALVSRNIANVNNEGATRKYANVVTGSGGRVEIRSVAQSANSVLFRNMLDSTSNLQQSRAIQSGLTRINEMIGDIENGQTPAALIGKLSDALEAYAASPNSYEFGKAAADAAGDVVSALKAGTDIVDTIRRDADRDLVAAAGDMTKLLDQFKQLNEEVMAGSVAIRDVTDAVDKRDQVVATLSKYVGVTALTRGNNDMVLYTDSGVTLFDKVPRAVSFTPTNPMVDGHGGNGFRIDGILVTGDNAMMPTRTGMVAGIVELRDHIAVKYQSQLDEMARGLMAATMENDGTNDSFGLFTVPGSSAVTTTGVKTAATIPGFARQIEVASVVVGNASRIRDGVSVTYNVGAVGGFTGRINSLVNALGASQTFGDGTEAAKAGSLVAFAASSTSWLQAQRSQATTDADYQETLLTRTKETLSNETGINLDTETLFMLDLEKSYQASSKVLTTVNEMLKTLMDAI